MSERLLAGEALTMEEFASMLEHGGLTDVQPAEERERSQRKARTCHAKGGPTPGSATPVAVASEPLPTMAWLPGLRPLDYNGAAVS